jgi:hypothetical protein
MNVSVVVVASLSLFQALIAFAAAPPNDNFVDAIPLAGTNLTVTGTNVDATREIAEPAHGAPGGKSVWWMWTAPGPGSAVIQTAGSTFDTLLAAYTSTSVNALAESLVAANDDSGSGPTSLIAFNVTAGTNYHIVVDGYNGASGSIRLSLNYRTNAIPPVPSNNNFTNRIALQGLEVATSGESYFATKEPGEPAHAEELGGASVWWSWVAPMSASVQIDTAGSNFDTLLAVYRGQSITNLTVTNLTWVASNDDASTNVVTSQTTFSAVAGTEYEIAVDGYDGQPGDIQLHISTVYIQLKLQWLQDGSREFSLTGPIGKPFTIETSGDLVHWLQLSTVFNTNGTVTYNDTSNPISQQFYRASQAQ